MAKEGCDLKDVARPPLVLDDSQNVPCFEPLLFLIGIMLLILFLLVGIK